MIGAKPIIVKLSRASLFSFLAVSYCCVPPITNRGVILPPADTGLPIPLHPSCSPGSYDPLSPRLKSFKQFFFQCREISFHFITTSSRHGHPRPPLYPPGISNTRSARRATTRRSRHHFECTTRPGMQASQYRHHLHHGHHRIPGTIKTTRNIQDP